MPQNETDIKKDISTHIGKEGGAYSTWYVGVTSDVERRLFGDHGVSKKNAWWIHRAASSGLIARRIEQYFISLGLDGGSGGGDDTATKVYAYKKTPSTNP